MTENAAEKLAEQVRAWCEAHGKEPIPRLRDATRALMFAMMPAIDARLTGHQPTEEDFLQSGRLGTIILAQHPPAERKALEESIQRLRDCMTEMGAAQQSEGKTEPPARAEEPAPHPSSAHAPPAEEAPVEPTAADSGAKA
jgi:hypothetical protein